MIGITRAIACLVCLLIFLLLHHSYLMSSPILMWIMPDFPLSWGHGATLFESFVLGNGTFAILLVVTILFLLLPLCYNLSRTATVFASLTNQKRNSALCGFPIITKLVSSL